MMTSEPARVPAPKRPYQSPHLTVHGTVAELTQAKLVSRPFPLGYFTAE
jgi:hypothetical protein